MKRYAALLLLFAAIACNASYAQTFQTGDGNGGILQLNTITTAVPFLMISGNAYEMGSANVGVVSHNGYYETAFTSNAALLASGHRYLATYLGWVLKIGFF